MVVTPNAPYLVNLCIFSHLLFQNSYIKKAFPKIVAMKKSEAYNSRGRLMKQLFIYLTVYYIFKF